MFGLFIAGFVPAFSVALGSTQAKESMVGTFIGAILAFSALEVGFIVALMLFTGTVGNMGALTLEQLKAHTVRIKYLLISQTITLSTALLVTVFCIFWLVAFTLELPELIGDVAAGIIGGFMLITLARTALLPLQIFELHSATLSDEMIIKAEETRNKYRRE
ncbi:hypothetical protein [Marilutibacter aestuarii]|uniref:Uncharacterized protein n=1 Tax=Marilutibacter aestuarii TaxID=1706195 RepID=A0A507ZRI1_9GAMM|nr:hypothetical protein [Lysobacter aestuarii]TQD40396.1 hypothetical protein FKV25_14295 [Lysobacter aestuarii]